MILNIYSPISSPRLLYTLDFLCRDFFQLDYLLHTSKSAYQAAKGPGINYSQDRIRKAECFIPACDLLWENEIQAPTIKVFQHQNLPAFFGLKQSQADFPFDLLALVFYLLSRYEEYLDFSADQHGRFTARQSLAYQQHFLQTPLVDLWAIRLEAKLQHYFPKLIFPARQYTFLPTYDIDMAWAYLHKPAIRFWGSLVKELYRGNISALGERLAVKVGRKKDPFFTFDYMEECHQKFHLQALYFFLLGKYGPFDKNINPQNVDFQNLIRKLAKGYRIGIHPSYRSNNSPEVLLAEKEKLENITGTKVKRSRQHYLKLKLPSTYRDLIALGIEEDYTLGYAEAIGFRASTCRSFYWYDLAAEKKTRLRLFPFAVMDVTLRQYLQYSPEEAEEKVVALIQKVRQVEGTFSTLWHNNSLSEKEGWEGWRKVYEGILKAAVQ